MQREAGGEPVIRRGTPPTPEDPSPSNQIVTEYPDGSFTCSTPPPTEKELREYREALVTYPDSAEIRVQSASILNGLSQREAALEQITEAVRLDPRSWYAHSILAHILAQTDLTGAIAAARESLRLIRQGSGTCSSQAEATARWGLAELLLRNGEGPEARAEMERALELQSELVRLQAGSPHLLAQLERELRKFG